MSTERRGVVTEMWIAGSKEKVIVSGPPFAVTMLEARSEAVFEMPVDVAVSLGARAMLNAGTEWADFGVAHHAMHRWRIRRAARTRKARRGWR